MAPTQPFRPRASKKTAVAEKAPDKRTSENRSRTSRNSDLEDSLGWRDTTSSQENRKRRRHGVASAIENGLPREGMSSNDNSDSDLDLDKPVYPIGEYVSNRKDLVDQMFRSLRRTTLAKMVPPILRGKSLKELRELCVFEIDGLSRKRIRAILGAQEFQSSSGTDDSEDEPPQGNRNEGSIVTTKTCDATADIRDTKLDVEKEKILPCAVVDTDAVPPPSQPGSYCILSVQPSEMELVELELRAQALRAMMARLDEEESVASSKSSLSTRSTESNGEVPKPVRGPSNLKDSFRKERDKTEKEFFEIHVDESELEAFT